MMVVMVMMLMLSHHQVGSIKMEVPHLALKKIPSWAVSVSGFRTLEGLGAPEIHKDGMEVGRASESRPEDPLQTEREWSQGQLSPAPKKTSVRPKDRSAAVNLSIFFQKEIRFVSHGLTNSLGYDDL